MKKYQRTLTRPRCFKQSISRQKIDKNRWPIDIIRKKHKKYKALSDKLSIEEVLFQRAVKTTFQKLYDKGLFNNFPNVDEFQKIFCLLEDVEVF